MTEQTLRQVFEALDPRGDGVVRREDFMKEVEIEAAAQEIAMRFDDRYEPGIPMQWPQDFSEGVVRLSREAARAALQAAAAVREAGD